MTIAEVGDGYVVIREEGRAGDVAILWGEVVACCVNLHNDRWCIYITDHKDGNISGIVYVDKIRRVYESKI